MRKEVDLPHLPPGKSCPREGFLAGLDGIIDPGEYKIHCKINAMQIGTALA
jgi:hypothetical protein